MKNDPTYGVERQAIRAEINARKAEREPLEAIYGQVWDEKELHRDFEVQAFLAPFVSVIRRSDAARGWMTFQHDPKYYWGFQADEK